MSIYENAKKLAKMGFYIFPLIENEKIPLIKDFTNLATNDPKDLARFWYDSVLGFEHYHNIGIATTKFKNGSLLIVDVDNKKDKNGSDTIIKLELQGFEFPKTLTQMTPTGGFHLIYTVKDPVPNSVEKIGKGLDIRGKGGYILGAGSYINGKKYKINTLPIVTAPTWLIKKCQEQTTKERKTQSKVVPKISQKGAKIRGKDYLLNHAQIAVEGSGGDQTTFMVANRLKDMGLNQKNCFNLMLDNWNDNCQPPWDADELKIKIENAYVYGQNKEGIDSPEADFAPIENDDTLGPIEMLNKQYAFVVLGGKSTILKQHKDGKVSYMSPQAFHDLLKADTIQTGNGKKRQLSHLWFSSPNRATYDSVELHPAKQAPPGVFNLWCGYKCEPLGKDEKPTKNMIEGVRLFKEHTLDNVCLGDKKLYNWLMGYFAHLMQRPWEKPLTALVFKGDKGVGKNATIDRIGNLFKGHYLITSNKRYLTSNFNKHLANLILFVLDEAFWSGDKQAEGILKDLITGHTHLIEHKGREMFSAKNVTRLCILGNEEWIVPATKDERRFAVFNVSDARQADKKYFIKMKTLIDYKGGNRLLLKELMDFDLNTVDINEAPDTIGLLEQKIESLNTIHSWWLSCLKEGIIFGLDFGENWPESISRSQLRDSYLVYAKQRNIKSWLPDASTFGKMFQKCLPGLQSKRSREGHSRAWTYLFPTLPVCRIHFEKFIRHKLEWEDEEQSNIDDTINIFS